MIAEILGPDFLIAALFTLVYVIPIVALINASTKSSESFETAGFSKPKWIFSMVLLTLLGSIIGLAVAIRYLSSTRPKINRAISEGILSLNDPIRELERRETATTPSEKGRHTRRRILIAVVVAVVIVAGVGTIFAEHEKTTNSVLSVIPACPKPLGQVLSQWCISGTANDLPFKMTIYTLKDFPPFTTAEGGTTSKIGSKVHVIGSECADLGVHEGALVVPLWGSLNQNVKVGPTGGISPAVFDFLTPGTFYTNPAGLASNSSDIKTEVVVDSNLITGWKCSTKSFFGYGDKSKSKDHFEFIGYFVLTGWSQYPWKNYMLKHFQLDIVTNPPAFNPASQSLYRGGTMSAISSRITHVSGPRTSMHGTGQVERVEIQLINTNFRTDLVKKSEG
jgi:hypothetical protein